MITRAGEDISYSDDYDQIKEARRADDPNEPRGDWSEEPKVAEWRKVRELATEVLTQKSKDLQVACWLCEAVTELHGFAGVHDGLELLRGLIENFWDTLYPPIEDGDLEPRERQTDLAGHQSASGDSQDSVDGARGGSLWLAALG